MQTPNHPQTFEKAVFRESQKTKATSTGLRNDAAIPSTQRLVAPLGDQVGALGGIMAHLNLQPESVPQPDHINIKHQRLKAKQP